jgi:hypothetical protein
MHSGLFLSKQFYHYQAQLIYLLLAGLIGGNFLANIPIASRLDRCLLGWLGSRLAVWLLHFKNGTSLCGLPRSLLAYSGR